MKEPKKKQKAKIVKKKKVPKENLQAQTDACNVPEKENKIDWDKQPLD